MNTSSHGIWLLAALMLLSPVVAWTQQKTDRSTDKKQVSTEKKQVSKSGTVKSQGVEVKKLEVILERTPASKGAKHGSKGAGGKWICVRAQVNVTGQDWLDEAEAHWSVLVDGGSKVKPILMKLDTKFSNLEKGKNYMTAFVDSTFFKKNFNTDRVSTSRISAKLDIAVKGKVVATKTEGNKAGLIATPDKCRLDDSSLVPRSKTPFKDVDADYYASEKID